MDVLPSTEFRKSFARLDKPVKVTVNGHVIGMWQPGQWVSVPEGMNLRQPVVGPVEITGGSQAQRDALLHKINKG